jgi:hypothetical protein
VRFQHRELAWQDGNIPIQAQSQIAVPAAGAIFEIGFDEVIPFDSRYDIDYFGHFGRFGRFGHVWRFAHIRREYREVSLSLPERNRMRQRRLSAPGSGRYRNEIGEGKDVYSFPSARVSLLSFKKAYFGQKTNFRAKSRFGGWRRLQEDQTNL